MFTRRKFLATAVPSLAAGPLTIFGTARGTISRSVSGRSGQVRLPDGRRLGWSQFGDPHGYPILYFHGLPTSRLEGALLARAAARQGCRLVSMDRPGIGLSSCQPGRTLVDWSRDVRHLTASGCLDGWRVGCDYSILGFSSGGPYAVQCAASLGDTGLRRVAVVSGVPLRCLGNLPAGEGDRALQLVRRWPNLARRLLKFYSRRAGRRPAMVANRAMHHMAIADRCLLGQAYYRQLFLCAFREATRQGPDGVVQDALLLTTCQQVALDRIELPVSIWHGACDRTILPVASQTLAAHVPGSRLQIVAGQGHVSLPHRFGPEILRWLQSNF